MPILTKPCPVCGRGFSYPRRGRREQRTCSRRCGALWKNQTNPRPPRPQAPRPTAVCQWCGQGFAVRHPNKPAACCSYRCAAHRRWSDPALHARASEWAARKSPRQRAVSAARMHRLNRDPAIRTKMAATMRGRGFVGQRGGNGQRTAQQEALASALGWPMEYAIPTGNPCWPCAIVDLAHPTILIAIEVDGASHHTAKQKNRDRRKERMLLALGWIVLRFWNAEITNEFARVVNTVRHAVAARTS